MRIAIDATTICDRSGGPGAGIEHYTWSIIFSLIEESDSNEFFIHVPRYFSGELKAKLIRSALPRIPVLSQHYLLPKELSAYNPDLLFCPSGSLPVGWKGKSVITVHDTAIFDHPEWFDEEKNQMFSTKFVVPRSIRKAEKIIAVSESTKQSLAKHFPASIGKTEVVYEGVRAINELPSQESRDEDVVLYLGTIEPRKNLINAIAAFNKFLKTHPERSESTRFILAGKMGWNTKAVEKAIENNPYIKAVGFVSEEQKWELLKQASCLFFPSYDEGFGLPVLEAMSVGTPVITSGRGSLPEIGGDSVVYVDPENIEQMSLALAQCLLVPEGLKYMVQDAKKRAVEFTWQRAAKETLNIFKSL